ncbi:hypothetical protein CCR95_05685 [Thiocystis minor]|nr:hypothetical protein [Thiocystis minor]
MSESPSVMRFMAAPTRPSSSCPIQVARAEKSPAGCDPRRSAAFLGRPCPLHAQTLADSCLLFVDLNRVRLAIERWPEVAFRMLTLVAERAQRLTADLEVCCLHSAIQRVAGFLLREAVSDPASPDHAELVLPAAKTVVASSLNLSPETFSRELHGLARRGLIEVERRRIRIPSLNRLRALAALDVERPDAPPPFPVLAQDSARHAH